MKIQNLVFPKKEICTEEQMFFRRKAAYNTELVINMEGSYIGFSEGARCSFDTYFNSLSVEKWHKYTSVIDFFLVVKLDGNFEISLTNKVLVDCAIHETVLYSRSISTDGIEEVILPYPTGDYKGMLAFNLLSCKDGSKYYGGWYGGEKYGKLWDTRIAINICTFKRETFVIRNLEILNKYIVQNTENELSKNLQIFISDNGNSLSAEDLVSEQIHIVQNKNVGGAGGFCRGLIEIMDYQDRYSATHVLMMDDDVVIEPESLFRTYALLRCRKPEYRDVFIGGAMLRLDKPQIQVESGALWNSGSIISNKHGSNLSNFEDVLRNEIEEDAEYNAWWFCCMPMHLINKDNLPLPVFIRGDDVEYGLRNMKTLVLMNGICVWHEPFENKYSSFLYYYTARNMLYNNALHVPNYKQSDFLKRTIRDVAREVAFYRYKHADLIIRGVNDFYKGVDFLLSTDGEKLHKEIMASGYKLVSVNELHNNTLNINDYNDSICETESAMKRLIRCITLNGYLIPAIRSKGNHVKKVSITACHPIDFYRCKCVLNYDSVSNKAFVTQLDRKKAFICIVRLTWLCLKSIFYLPHAMATFRKRKDEVTSLEFWVKYLAL